LPSLFIGIFVTLVAKPSHTRRICSLILSLTSVFYRLYVFKYVLFRRIIAILFSYFYLRSKY